MKTSVRTKFTLATSFFFVVVAAITTLSAYQFYHLSQKTNAILKENQISVICARQMANYIYSSNMAILPHNSTDSRLIESDVTSNLNKFSEALHTEQQNITEPGERELVKDIENSFMPLADSLTSLTKTTLNPVKLEYIKQQSNQVYNLLMQLSAINERAIEYKTNDAKQSVSKALVLVSIVATISFLVALSFAFNFTSYFNSKFSSLYNGLKQLSENHFEERLYFEGKDEFNEIGQIFNQVAEKLGKEQKDLASAAINQQANA
jgi:methyl-accepting chemotaxis protein